MIKSSNLFVNIGNSNIRFAYFNKNKLVVKVEKALKYKKDGQKKIKLKFQQIKKHIEIKNIFISAVNPWLTPIFLNFLKKQNVKYKLIERNDVNNINFDYIDNDVEIGQDLLAQMAFIENESIIISLGTSTVISYIDNKMNFKGCSITLGINSIINNLLNTTGIKINNKNDLMKANNKSLGINTEQSLISGIINNINYHIERIKNEYNVSKKCKIIYTGGNSKFINFNEWIYIEELEIKGLIKLFNNN